MNAMMNLLFDSDDMTPSQWSERLATMRVQRQRWIAGFHPDSRVRRAAFNASGVRVGSTTHIAIGMVVLDDYKQNVTIGERCSIGNYVSIMSAVSPDDSVLAEHPELQSAIKVAPVTIGDDCWIGTGAIIMPGVTIANNGVVGAGAVVTKNVKPYEIVNGVPARLMRTLSVM